MSANYAKLIKIITDAQHEFAKRLRIYLDSDFDKILAYQRYLSFQYHLTKGVQRHFLQVAAHHRLAKMRGLRYFLFKFANEEELHYLVAANDLINLKMTILPEPFDVTLWQAYFTSILTEKPFVRLGATTVLENISSGEAKTWTSKALSSEFLNKNNTKFLILHQHETLPHGEQIMTALQTAPLTQADVSDLELGALQGTVLYLRMVDWAIGNDLMSARASARAAEVSSFDLEAGQNFGMHELEFSGSD